MSRKASAVIGANFGDEGKGRTVDWLSGPYTLVVRFNGGAQAGHTVVTPDGRRHVFHHFGSGTFAGARTFLSRFFLLNPMIFVDELKELGKLGVRPFVYADPRCEITTPWDMLVNRALEDSRGEKRHGSCGTGVHETMVRKQEGVSLKFGDFAYGQQFRRKLEGVREYQMVRAKAKGLDQQHISLMAREGMMTHFLDDCTALAAWCHSAEWGSQNWRCPILDTAWNIVFEGAQGLRLDQDTKEYFPYVTHAKTGMHNILSLLVDARMSHSPIDVYYVTRPYITRHGAGPLPHEVQQYPKFEDQTNVKNQYQGPLRFGVFEKQEFLSFVCKDISYAKEIVNPILAVSCLDQVGDEVQWFDEGELRKGNPQEWARSLAWLIDAKSAVLFDGPTRDSTTLVQVR